MLALFNFKFLEGVKMIVINTQGIVLRRNPFNDSDVMLTIFTKSYGKVSAVAKGAQRQKNRHLFTSQIFSYNSYVLKKGKELFMVNQSESIKSFYDISKDFESFSYASFIVKFVEQNSEEGQPNINAFELLAKSLFLLSQGVENKLLVLCSFILKYIDYIGYKPEVNICTVCGEKNWNYAHFSIENGGIVCDKCLFDIDKYNKIDQTTISLMQYILKNDIIVCSKAKVSEILLRELFNLLKTYLAYYFDNVNFSSLDILGDIH